MLRAQIKARSKELVKRLATWPLVGRLVRIAIAMVRLPDMYAIFKQVEAYRFEHKDIANLVNSTPVSLRLLKRGELEVRQELQSVKDEIARHKIQERDLTALDSRLAALERELDRLGRLLEDRAS